MMSIFICRSSTSFALPRIAYCWSGVLDVVFDTKQAVQELHQKGWRTPSTAERCRAAFRRLQALPNEVWELLEPVLQNEIAVLHHFCASDKDLQ
jgi:hypothetical protein